MITVKKLSKEVVSMLYSYDKETTEKELRRWQCIIDYDEDKGYCPLQSYERFWCLQDHLKEL